MSAPVSSFVLQSSHERKLKKLIVLIQEIAGLIPPLVFHVFTRV
jgi:hypothetical protein